MPAHPDVNGVDLPGLLALIIVLAAVFLPMLLGRRGRGPDDPGPDADGGGGNGGPGPPDAPHDRSDGGLPLDEAEPARVRLRDHRRLADLLPQPDRRRIREPARSPRRVRQRRA